MTPEVAQKRPRPSKLQLDVCYILKDSSNLYSREKLLNRQENPVPVAIFSFVVGANRIVSSPSFGRSTRRIPSMFLWWRHGNCASLYFFFLSLTNVYSSADGFFAADFLWATIFDVKTKRRAGGVGRVDAIGLRKKMCTCKEYDWQQTLIRSNAGQIPLIC